MAELFDIVANRYGWDLKTFYSLTRRQIRYLARAIKKNKRIELENLAAVNGRKLKASPMSKPLNLSKEQRKEADDQAKKLLERMQNRAFEKERIQARLEKEADAQGKGKQ